MPQGLALSALSRGLNATMICKKKGHIQISKKLANLENRKITLVTSNELLKKAKKMGMKIVDKNPSLSDIENALINNTIPIVMINMKLLHKTDSPHWIVAVGIDEKTVWINDPLNKNGKNLAIKKDLFLHILEKTIKVS